MATNAEECKNPEYPLFVQLPVEEAPEGTHNQEKKHHDNATEGPKNTPKTIHSENLWDRGEPLDRVTF